MANLIQEKEKYGVGEEVGAFQKSAHRSKKKEIARATKGKSGKTKRGYRGRKQTP